MKFAHLLEQLSGNSAEFRVLHATYKSAKKQIKRLQQTTPASQQQTHDEAGPCSNEVLDGEVSFAASLLSSVQALNNMRCTKQEHLVDTMRQLEVRAAEVQAGNFSHEDGQHEFYSDLVQFHGQALLAMNWSIMAYTTVLKILKKHQKWAL